jgi:hypothetical protein
MSELNGYSIVLRAVRGLNAAKSWTGKTHVIKSLYIASTKVDLPFEFVLFKHGPYSFDANDAIESMSAVGFLSLIATPPYGVQLKPGRFEGLLGNDVEPSTIATVDRAIELVGSAGVQELEAFATSIWVAEKSGFSGDDDWLKAVKELKPHLADKLIIDGIAKAKEWNSSSQT